MTAVFEIVPTEKNNSAVQTGFASGKLADLSVESCLPADSVRKQLHYICDFRFSQFNEINKCQRFSAAVVMFGSKLRASPYTRNVEWNDIISIANSAADVNDIQQKEFINLVEKAKGLYIKSRKKKKRSKKEEGE